MLSNANLNEKANNKELEIHVQIIQKQYQSYNADLNTLIVTQSFLIFGHSATKWPNSLQNKHLPLLGPKLPLPPLLKRTGFIPPG